MYLVLGSQLDLPSALMAASCDTVLDPFCRFTAANIVGRIRLLFMLVMTKHRRCTQVLSKTC